MIIDAAVNITNRQHPRVIKNILTNYLPQSRRSTTVDAA
jgi:flagellar motor component MotA